ncbi:hypothetical protein ABS71_12335 [bacterium SCN 62-11]|nr:MAG: hypothetical protein ABS71_12335 [bacterium SCN 62-11]
MFSGSPAADIRDVELQLLEIFREIRAVQRAEDLPERTVAAGIRCGLWDSATFSPEGQLLSEPSLKPALAAEIESQLHYAREKLIHTVERLRLRALFDSIPDLIWIKSRKGEFLECNHRFETLLGADRSGIIGKSDYDFVPAEVADFFLEHDQRAMEAGVPLRNEEWVTFADGHQELLETVKAPFLEDSEVLGVLGIARNQTDHWHARRRLVESEQRQRLFLEHSPAAVAMFDQHMNYLLVSKRFAADYRLSDSDLVGRNHWEVFPDLPERWREIHLRCLSGSVESCAEDSFTRGDGTVDWVRWEMRPWYEIDDTIGGVILFSELITAAKVAELALRENEELLRAMFEVAPVGIALLDTAEVRLLRVNPSLCRLTGYSQAELLEGQGSLWGLLRGAGHSEELQYGRRDGSTAWLEVRHCPLAAGQCMLLVQDITQRRLLEDNRRLQTSALQAAAHGIVITDQDGRVEWVNQAFLQHTGYTQMEVVGRPVGMTKAGHLDGTSYPRLWDTLRHGRIWHGETKNRHKNGSSLSIEETITPVIAEDGRISHYVAIQQDISERLESQQALASSEEKFRGLVESLDDMILSSDREGSITFVNRAVTSCLSWQAEQLLGTPLVDLLYAEDRPELTIGHREMRLLDVQGRARSAWCRVRHEENGGLILVCTDLTRQRETEEQLRAAQRMEAVGRLAGGVAHDFNNLLTVILSYSELAQSELRRDDPLFADIEEIRAAGKRAEGLTRQLLTFSRRQMMQLETIDLNQLMAGLTRMLQRLIGEDVELTFTGQRDLLSIRADRGQIEQVVMNLAVNARDAMADGGSLKVATEVLVVGEEQASALELEAGPYVCLSVQDSGCGMDADTQRRMFEPFYTTKGLGKGTGLGLSTVYGIVKQSGGSIGVDSRPGQGTRMAVYFPALVEEAPQEVVREAPCLPQRTGETLLIVEDEPALRSVLHRVLTNAGYRVMTAANAGEALLLCEGKGNDIDLLLTDVIMPGMNGRELAQRLKPLCPRAKQMFMSGYTDEALERFEFTEENFLSKPFDWQTVNLKVRAVLEA